MRARDADIEFDFGANVRRLRQEAGWSQSDLAEAMTNRGYGMHQVTVGKVETAQRPTRLAEVAAFAITLNVAVEDLLQPMPPCEQCEDEPPHGFTCNTCGRSS